MAHECGSETSKHAGEDNFASACRDVGTALLKGMVTVPFTVSFNLYWGSTAFGLRLFEQMMKASLSPLQPPEKIQKK
jgi:hypothetical protein